jgi:hypothetical protein
MSNTIVKNGWERLPNGFDVEFRHNIPVRISDNGHGMTVPEEVLLEEVTALGKLHVCLGDWESGERAGEREASLYVSAGEFAEVLKRLATASAALFVERYHKPVDKSDVDWDRLEYLKDFETALECCRLSTSDVDRDACFDDYVEIMHSETRRLAQTGERPAVGPE